VALAPLELMAAEYLPGIALVVTATPPSGNSGQYSFVQLITNDVEQVIFPPPYNREQCIPSPWAPPELDNKYPYGGVYSNNMNDSPDIALDQANGEEARNFSATTYGLWTPTQDGACNAGVCMIPVPLGYVSWSWEGDAINTLQNQSNETTWNLLSCSSDSVNTFQASSTYPTWTTTWVSKNQQYSCNSE
jgi:hypothetical protein